MKDSTRRKVGDWFSAVINKLAHLTYSTMLYLLIKVNVFPNKTDINQLIFAKVSRHLC